MNLSSPSPHGELDVTIPSDSSKFKISLPLKILLGHTGAKTQGKPWTVCNAAGGECKLRVNLSLPYPMMNLMSSSPHTIKIKSTLKILLGHTGAKTQGKPWTVCNAARGECELRVNLSSPSPHGEFDITILSNRYKLS